ncbi:coniferyl aldehyde dehydrogenase [Oleomonas cavernae]|uniref:Aldehyde dehydrogenase n=1 Tax=Oleomonas cavernae TaxID=2320859 RepID=A0A418WBZ2_9PROT|nr:coniferyl aldehyde dehydrogenase [Oleomonas cavernae]RJF87494.1 coniferyl aldehyde dehydrogenase [Oleomonas cavernae]
MSVAEARLDIAGTTDIAGSLRGILDRQRADFLKAGPPSLEERRARLDKLRASLMDNKDALIAAVSADFGHRSTHETLLTDFVVTVEGIKHMRKHVAKWMKPERRPVSINYFPASNKILFQPLGVIGVISPWNYPIQLAYAPMAAAIAAGNRVMLKPSEYTPRTSEAMAKALRAVFTDNEVAVITGGPDVGEAFSRLPFDHMLFTGATSVGKHVMRAAAENLVPVTLELGGKSPAIVDRAARMDAAVSSIVTGKLLNAGQTCVAPDYVFVPNDKREEFVDLVKAKVAKMYPTLKDNADYTSVVNQRHYDRLRGLIADAQSKGARVVEVNPANESFEQQPNHKIPPTLILDPTDDMKIMQDEIFGPLMPIKTYTQIDEAIDYVNGHARPLALYVFSDDKGAQDKVMSRTTSGGACINETVMHVGQEDLPFGGVGPSGMGSYHGRDGFMTFSHKKAVMHQSKYNLLGMMRPPYGKRIERLLGFMLK